MGPTRDFTPRARAVIYCVVPRDLAPKLHEPLRRHFRDDPTVEVVVERREADRRRSEDRRRADRSVTRDRRRIRATEGRRVADSRGPAVRVEPPPLPRRVRPYAERLAFYERLAPTDLQAEDRDTAALVTRFQGGDTEAFGALYMRYFDRVYAYMKIVLADPHESEDAAQQAFANAFGALPRYERRRQPFRAWLFTIARNQALNQLRARNRPSSPVDPAEMARHAESAASVPDELPDALGWVSDNDLVVLIGRLPLPQRQVLVLRYLLDLRASEIAEVLGRSTDDVRMLQHRAQRFLRDRLTALGREPRHDRRTRMRQRIPEATVLRARRFSILR